MPELAPCLRVEAGGRLVEEEQLRVPDDAQRDIHPAARTLVVESMPLASAGAGGNTTTGRPDLPSTIRWTESGFAHAADRVRQGVDHVAGPDRRFPAGDRVTPARCVTGRNTVQERRGRRRLADGKPLGE